MSGSSPNWPFGYVPPATEWNTWWGNKVDGQGGQIDSPTITGTCQGAPTWAGMPTFSAGAAINAPISGTAFGMGVGQAPVWQSFNSGTIPTLQLGAAFGQGLMLIRTVPTINDQWDLRLRREAAVTGGAASNINSNLRIDTTTAATDGAQNVSLLIINKTSSSVSGAMNPAFWVQATRLTGSTAYSSGMVINHNDQTGLASSVSGANSATEITVQAQRADDIANADTFGGIGGRKIIHLQFGRSSTGDTTQTEISTGLWFATVDPSGLGGRDANANFQQVIGFSPNTQVRQVLDTRGTIPPTGVTDPVAAVRTGAGHIIDFNGGSSLTSAPGNYLQYTTSGTARLRYMVGASEQWSVGDAGAATATQFNVTSAGPNIRAGTGAATGTQPAGSLWLRTDGSAGARVYVSAGGGTWAAISGV